jgi:hypothetical protein
MHRIRASRFGLVALAFAWATGASAQSTYRITELFSNQDGSIQFIRLTETAGLDEQNAFQNLAITVTYGGGTRQWVFPNALPTLQTGHRDVVVGISPLVPYPELGEVPSIFQYTSCCVAVTHPDYVMPANFLPTDGATVDFAGIDRITYAALPTDGASALFADQHVGVAELPFATCPGAPPFSCPAQLHPTPTLITAVEYYNAARDHYFVTASAPDIDALDTGRFAGWQRTGESFPVGAHAMTRLGLEYTYYGNPVCRFYIPPAEGDSHFFSGFPDECAAVESRFPDFVLETSSAFYAGSPVPDTGVCPVMPGFLDGDIALRPVFRLWNGRADTNHRYTTRLDLRAAMIDRGWVSEGYGPLGVAFCVN